MDFVGLKMQFCWTKNVRLNIRNVCWLLVFVGLKLRGFPFTKILFFKNSGKTRAFSFKKVVVFRNYRRYFIVKVLILQEFRHFKGIFL
jgi:hypothetical protein